MTSNLSVVDPLLPSNATPLEEELAELTGRIDDLDPSVIETIWDAWRCPAQLLPWFAWALSVDLWDDAWDEIRKRQAIHDSPYYHRIKGTRLAVELALKLLNVPTHIIEWWEITPPARRATARILVESLDLTTAKALREKARQYVRAAKPKSRSVFVDVGQRIDGVLMCGAALAIDRVIQIDPYLIDIPPVDGALLVGAAMGIDRIVQIEVG